MGLLTGVDPEDGSLDRGGSRGVVGQRREGV